MSNFWELSDGDDVVKTGGKFEVGGGNNFEPIPNNTNCVAVIDESGVISNPSGLRLISLRWSILTPVEYKNRKVFHKLWVFDHDPQAKDPIVRKDKAKKMLFAIDNNCGGKLMASGKEPSNQSLQASLMNTPMQIKVNLMKRDDGTSMNWISSVSPRGGGAGTMSAAASPKVADDDVPF